jgi:hypothetical protein
MEKKLYLKAHILKIYIIIDSLNFSEMLCFQYINF